MPHNLTISNTVVIKITLIIQISASFILRNSSKCWVVKNRCFLCLGFKKIMWLYEKYNLIRGVCCFLGGECEKYVF